MPRPSFSRLESSQSIDELLSLSDRRHPPNWLLTYIDVFVLVVMLVVTLVALSSFEPVPSQARDALATVTAPAPPEAAASAKAERETTPEQAPVEPAAPESETAAPETEDSTAEIEPVAPIPVEPAENAAIEVAPSVVEPVEEPAVTEERALPSQEVTESVEQMQPTEPPPEQASQQQLQQQLEQLGLNNSINMTVTQGYAQLEIQDNILYQSSEAALTESGRAVLSKLTPLLKQAKGLIYIEGHTDNRPIKTAQFPSNWELGAARATSVLHFLASQQIDAARMRAVTYADTKPVADNASEQGRQKNRRVNIVIKVSDEDENE
ncbi:OmpA/MotB family protein [Methylomarinum vadi]|uniref:OmpA/MotB family protein n=1 Tax=Methylomarinum vadi TaxID=438855 RepID=UPI00068AD650|nr:OmpA family protein [Methylomarinum vadi]